MRIFPRLIVSSIIILTCLVMARSAKSWDFLFSNKSYASNLTVQSLIIEGDQLNAILQDKSENLAGFTREFKDKVCPKAPHVFIRIKNTGNKAVWGKLSIDIIDRRPIELNVPSIEPNSDWCRYVIYYGGLIPLGGKKIEVHTKWKELYAK